MAYCLNIRQKYSENIFRTALEQHGGRVNAGWTLKNFVLNNDTDDYKVSAEITDQSGTTVAVKSTGGVAVAVSYQSASVSSPVG